MKHALLALVMAVPIAAASAAQSSGSHFAVGTVRAVDKAAGTATITHEPVASLDWPAMTMEFRAAGPAVLERLPKDARVAFEFSGSDGDWQIVNAIPLPGNGSSAGQSRGSGHGGMGGMMGGGMMGGMRDMCMDMMGRGKR